MYINYDGWQYNESELVKNLKKNTHYKIPNKILQKQSSFAAWRQCCLDDLKVMENKQDVYDISVGCCLGFSGMLCIQIR